MQFFDNFTIQKAVGLFMIIAGAIITYKSEKIALAIKKPQYELAIKICGLGIVITAFIIIMTAE